MNVSAENNQTLVLTRFPEEARHFWTKKPERFLEFFQYANYKTDTLIDKAFGKPAFDRAYPGIPDEMKFGIGEVAAKYVKNRFGTKEVESFVRSPSFVTFSEHLNEAFYQAYLRHHQPKTSTSKALKRSEFGWSHLEESLQILAKIRFDEVSRPQETFWKALNKEAFHKSVNEFYDSPLGQRFLKKRLKIIEASVLSLASDARKQRLFLDKAEEKIDQFLQRKKPKSPSWLS